MLTEVKGLDVIVTAQWNLVTVKIPQVLNVVEVLQVLVGHA